MTVEGGPGAPAPDDGPGPDVSPSWSVRVRTRQWWIAAAVVVALAAVGVTSFQSRSTSGSLDAADVGGLVDKAVGKAIAGLEAKPAPAAEVYEVIRPSLVLIRTQRPAGVGTEAGLGTGFVVNDDGAILTSLHVVAGATTIRVTFADGTESRATVQTSDPANDTAVLAPDRLPEVVVPAVLGGSSRLRVGDQAIAVGNPLGLVGSLSSGVISALDRSIPIGDGRTLAGLIQFDAAVNPGNSGGPLLDRNGQVIGVVTALADPSDDGHFVGIGFAVPITTAGGAAGAAPR